MMQPIPPSSLPQSRTSGPPQRLPFRARLTDHLVYTWERLRPSQQQAAWQLVENMRVTVAQEATRRRRRELLLGILVVGVSAADGVLMYLLLSAPAH